MFFFDFILTFFFSFLLLVFILLGVGFLTLMERKILGFIQFRKGPDKVGLKGIFQPFGDAVKLFSKGYVYLFLSNQFMFYFFPLFSLCLSLFTWMSIPYWTKIYSFDLSSLFFLCCSSLGVYSMIGSGWSSNSNYAMLGSLRSVAQSISYEVSLSLIFISFLMLVGSFNLFMFLIYQNYVWFLFISFPLSICWFSSMLAETNRTPFDFSEGESELVSGFNVEYSGVGFSLIFMSEYSMILFFSFLFSTVFLGGNLMSLIFYFKVLFIVFLFILLRGSLPRFRYDKLMFLAWKSYLPISLNFLLFFCGLYFLFFSFLL